MVAEASGLSSWQLRRSFSNADCLYRATVSSLINQISSRISQGPTSSASVCESIRAFVSHCAQIVEAPSYNRLLYLLIRDGRACPFVNESYEEKILRPMKQGLERAVEDAGRRCGTVIGVRKGAANHLVRTLEIGLAVPRLLPAHVVEAQEDKTERLVSALTAELMAHTFALEFATQAA